MQTENWIEQGNVFKTCLTFVPRWSASRCQTMQTKYWLFLTSSITDRDGKSWIRSSFALTLGGHTVLFRDQKIQLNWIIFDVYFTSFSHLLLYYFSAYILEGNRRLQEDYAIFRLFCLSYLLLWKRCTRNAKTRKPPKLFMFDIRYSNVN